MDVFATLDAAPKNAVLMIGNFDGVHKGHRVLITQAKKKADTLGKPLGLLTFEPHPRALFRPDDPPFRITSFDVKVARLEKTGIDFIVALPFDWPFASQGADAFVQKILKDGLSPAHILVGFDFRFGQLRKGTPDTLREASLDITVLDEVGDESGYKFSSSAVREHLRKGNIDAANKILGWEWYFQGEIVHGDRRGHELGYPTANVRLGDTLHPAYGVYASLVQIEGEEGWRPAATNIGIRPMFELEEGQAEAFILDFPDRDLYGKTLKIRPVSRLRGEAKFEDLPALIAQIDQDVLETRRILAI